MAMNDQLILLQLKQMPENLRQEVLDFIAFLLSKHQKNNPKVKTKPTFGCGAVQIVIAPDFDEPLEDFKAYME